MPQVEIRKGAELLLPNRLRVAGRECSAKEQAEANDPQAPAQKNQSEKKSAPKKKGVPSRPVPKETSAAKRALPDEFLNCVKAGTHTFQHMQERLAENPTGLEKVMSKTLYPATSAVVSYGIVAPLDLALEVPNYLGGMFTGNKTSAKPVLAPDSPKEMREKLYADLVKQGMEAEGPEKFSVEKLYVNVPDKNAPVEVWQVFLPERTVAGTGISIGHCYQHFMDFISGYNPKENLHGWKKALHNSLVPVVVGTLSAGVNGYLVVWVEAAGDVEQVGKVFFKDSQFSKTKYPIVWPRNAKEFRGKTGNAELAKLERSLNSASEEGKVMRVEVAAQKTNPTASPDSEFNKAINQRSKDLKIVADPKRRYSVEGRTAANRIVAQEASFPPPGLNFADRPVDPALAEKTIPKGEWDTLWKNTPKLSYEYVLPEDLEKPRDEQRTVRANYVRFGNPKSSVKLYSAVGWPDCTLSQIPYMQIVAEKADVDIVIVEIPGKGTAERNIKKFYPTIDHQAQVHVALLQQLGFTADPEQTTLIVGGFSNGPHEMGAAIASGKVPLDAFLGLAGWYSFAVPESLKLSFDEWMILNVPFAVKMGSKLPVFGVKSKIKSLGKNAADKAALEKYSDEWKRTFGNGLFVPKAHMQELKAATKEVTGLYKKMDAYTGLVKPALAKELQGKPVFLAIPQGDKIIRTEIDTQTAKIPDPSGAGIIKLEGTDAKGKNHALRVADALEKEFGAQVETHFLDANHLMFEAAPELAEKIIEFIKKVREGSAQTKGVPVSLFWQRPNPTHLHSVHLPA